MWQWVAMGAGAAGMAVFALLWRLERSRRDKAESETAYIKTDRNRIQAELSWLKEKLSQEAEVQDQIQEIQDEAEGDIENLDGLDDDELVDLMRNASAPDND